jgi:hypothetical protein
MKLRSLDILSVSSWVLLTVCAAALLFLAFTIPNVISISRVKDRDKNIEAIRASTDLQEVQQIAAWRTREEAYITEAARLLLIISVVALLCCMICTGVNLLQIRRIRRELKNEDIT